VVPPFIPIEPRTSRRAWALLALLPLMPWFALFALQIGLEVFGVDLYPDDEIDPLFFCGCIVAFGWQLLMTLWIAALAASIAIKSRSGKPLILAAPSLGILLVAAIASALD
jgi:hypothetical protein